MTSSLLGHSMLSLAIAKTSAHQLFIGFAFVNKDAPILVVASQFLFFQIVLFVLRPGAFFRAILVQQPLFFHFLSRFFYIRDKCNPVFGIAFGTFTSLPS